MFVSITVHTYVMPRITESSKGNETYDRGRITKASSVVDSSTSIHGIYSVQHGIPRGIKDEESR